MFRFASALSLLLFCLFAKADSTNIISISAGSSADHGSFLSDRNFTGGTAYFNGAAIDTSQVTNPAPVATYQHCRYDNFSYLIPGLEAGASHLVRLHFAELYATNPGQRTFNVSINGSQVLTGLDVFAESGGFGVALVKEFTVNADAAGHISLNFTNVVGHAIVNGIEVISGYQPHPVPSPTYNLILSADQPSYAVGAKANILLTTRNEPTNEEFEFHVTATFAGVDLPLNRITGSQSYGTTPALTAGDHPFIATLYLQNKNEAKALNAAIDFYISEIARLNTALGNTTNPSEIAAIQAQITRNQSLLTSTRAHLARVRTVVGQPVIITISAQ